MVTVRLDDKEIQDMLNRLYELLQEACNSSTRLAEICVFLGSVLTSVLSRENSEKKSIAIASEIAGILGSICADMKKRNLKLAAPVKLAIIVLYRLLQDLQQEARTTARS